MSMTSTWEEFVKKYKQPETCQEFIKRAVGYRLEQKRPIAEWVCDEKYTPEQMYIEYYTCFYDKLSEKKYKYSIDEIKNIILRDVHSEQSY